MFYDGIFMSRTKPTPKQNKRKPKKTGKKKTKKNQTTWRKMK